MQQNAYCGPNGRHGNARQSTRHVISTAADVVITAARQSSKNVVDAVAVAAMQGERSDLHDVVYAQGEGGSVGADAGGIAGGIRARWD